MVFTTIMKFSAARRVPLIKFRKGGYAYGGSASPAAPNQASSSSNPAASKAASSGHTIEDWELPPRYWRKPIDSVEMEYINRGGPA